MSTADNKKLLQHIFAELAQSNAAPFVEAMADDFRWIAPGSAAWSGTYVGKKAVIDELWRSLRHEMEGRIRTVPHRFIAEGDLVVVEARGDNVTKAGKPYRNTYCMVFRLAGGKLKDCTEYMDTELVTAVLAPPQFPPTTKAARA